MADDLDLDTKREAGSPEKAHRRWMLELKLALKREKDWRGLAKDTLDAYRGRNRKKNSFNILWANTEVMRPALYNSPPKPDVRRRFRQKDVLGKAVSEVMERSLSYCSDAYDLDNVLQNDVLDALLPGRGVSRVRYIPKFTVPSSQAGEGASPTPLLMGGPLPAEGPEGDEGSEREELEYEQALCDHVQWDDLLHGPGKTWEEVEWVAFRAKLCREDLIEKFGKEIGKEIALNDVDDSDLNDGKAHDDLKEVFKRAELWEIWDRDGQKVFFINESYKKDLLYPVVDGKPGDGTPPLKLRGFYPIPRPLQLTEDTGNLVPMPLYEMYREQAAELDRISTRINRIINACRVRFVYDSSLSELKALMDSGDNEGIPTENARTWLQNGGIDKAIWFMPVQQIAMVLKELYIARDQSKQVIYEITGLADILRGATNPNETLGAQQLKANSSSLRLQRMKVEVQRYARDLLRLLAEVIGENFDYQTLAQMTGLQFPTAQQKQAVQLQMQAGQQMMQQPGAQPPPEVQQKMQQAQQMVSMPSWEDIMGVLKSDIQREYRIDIETDSTIAQSLQEDMAGLREVLEGIVAFWQGVGPAVQAKAVSMEAVKAITMTIVRRARMGLEVEDALEAGMQEPKAQDNGEEAKAQAEAQKAQAQAQVDGAKAQAEAQAEAVKEQEITKRQEIEAQNKLNIRQTELEKEDIFNRWKAELEADTKIIVAEIGASKPEAGEGTGTTKRQSPLAAIAQAQADFMQKISDTTDMLGQGQSQMAAMVQEHMQKLAAEAGAPVQFHKGPDGRMAAVQKGGRVLPVVRGPDGRPTGLGTMQ